MHDKSMVGGRQIKGIISKIEVMKLKQQENAFDTFKIGQTFATTTPYIDLISLTFSSVVIFYQVWQVCWFLAQTENFYQRRMLNFVLTSLNPKLLFGRDLFTQLGLFSLIFVKLLSEEEKCLLTFVWVIFYDRLLLFNLGGNYLECFCEKPPPPWTASLSPVTNTQLTEILFSS